MIVITRMAVTVTQATAVILIATQIIVEVEVEVGVKVAVIRLAQSVEIISKTHLKRKAVVPWPLLY